MRRIRSDAIAKKCVRFCQPAVPQPRLLEPVEPLIAVEPRIDTAVLLSGGILGPRAPEVDAWNYAPRVKVPVLMLNGRDDFIYPAATRQIPLFEALGAADKRRLEFEGGHVNLMTRVDVIREILQCIDSRLGRQTQR